MKKNLLFIFGFVLLSFIGQAQITKGSVLIGGGLSFSETKNNSNNESTGFVFSPSAGIAIKENKVLGLQLYYGHSSADHSSTPITDNHNNLYGAAIFLRHYLSIAKNFYLFGQGQAGVDYNKAIAKGPLYYQKTESFSTSVIVYPGLSYALTKRFQLEVAMNSLVQLSYTTAKSSVTTGSVTTSNKSTGVNLGLSFNPYTNLALGFRIILGK